VDRDERRTWTRVIKRDQRISDRALAAEGFLMRTESLFRGTITHRGQFGPPDSARTRPWRIVQEQKGDLAGRQNPAIPLRKRNIYGAHGKFDAEMWTQVRRLRNCLTSRMRLWGKRRSFRIFRHDLV